MLGKGVEGFGYVMHPLQAYTSPNDTSQYPIYLTT
jgi:hypothetical protein